MTTLAATLFTNPMVLGSQTFWLIIPISVVVAVVYKTVRTTNLRRLPMEALHLSIYVLASEAALLILGWAFLFFLL